LQETKNVAACINIELWDGGTIERLTDDMHIALYYLNNLRL